MNKYGCEPLVKEDFPEYKYEYSNETRFNHHIPILLLIKGKCSNSIKTMNA